MSWALLGPLTLMFVAKLKRLPLTNISKRPFPSVLRPASLFQTALMWTGDGLRRGSQGPGAATAYVLRLWEGPPKVT